MKPYTIAAAASIARYEVRSMAGAVLWISAGGGFSGDYCAPTSELAHRFGSVELWAVWHDGDERHERTAADLHSEIKEPQA